MTLNKITEDCRATGLMEKHDFLHCNRSTKNHLIYVRFPGWIRAIAQFSVKFQFRFSASQTWRGIDFSLWPLRCPLRQKKMMYFIWRYNMAYRSDCLHFRNQLVIKRNW